MLIFFKTRINIDIKMDETPTINGEKHKRNNQ